jgi:hypothetical protein
MRATAALSLLVILTAGVHRPLPAQQARPWFVALRALPTAFSSAANAENPEVGELSNLGPAPDLRGGLAVGRRFGRWEGAFSGGYGTHGLRGSDGDRAATIEPGYTLVTLAVTAAYALATTGSGARVQLFAGPTLQFWSGEAVPDSRTRVGGIGGLGVVAPLAGRLSLDAHAALGLAASPIETEELADLDSTYDVGVLWSRELGVGLRLSF